MQLESLYQEIILDHYRRPHGKGLREPYDAEVHHVNPLCGDEVTLRVSVKDAGGEPTVADISYDALGCSISQASASVMTDLVVGKTVDEAMAISGEFLKLMQSKGEGAGKRRRAHMPPEEPQHADADGQTQQRRAEATGGRTDPSRN